MYFCKKKLGLRTIKLVFGQVLCHRNKPEQAGAVCSTSVLAMCILRLLNLYLFYPFLNVQNVVHQLG